MIETVIRGLHWIQQGGPYVEKHVGWRHPICVWIVHHMAVAAVMLAAHDAAMHFYDPDYQPPKSLLSRVDLPPHRLWTARFLLAYAACHLVSRLWINLTTPFKAKFRHAVLYEQTFLCNVTIILASLAIFAHRPIIATSFCVAIGIDQILWYADLAVYALCGKFPIGVSKYMFWPGTPWIMRLTCLHHLWTIPLILYGCDGLHVMSLPLSFVAMTSNVLLSRFMTPKFVGDRKDKDVRAARLAQSKMETERYLNINLSHELWKDIKLGFLQISKDNPPCGLYLFRLFWRWQLFSTIIFVLLYTVSNRVFGEAPAQ